MSWTIFDLLAEMILAGAFICLIRFALNRRKAWIARGSIGATAIEYVLIAALVAVACVVALEAMGGSISALFKAR